MSFEAPAQFSRGRHPSLPYEQMPAFMAALRSREAVAAQLLEFLILRMFAPARRLTRHGNNSILDAAVWAVPF